MIGPLLRLSDLNDAEARLVQATLAAETRKRRPASFDDERAVYMDVLWMYGIMCPHPEEMRLHEGSREQSRAITLATWYYCQTCLTRVINEVWMAAHPDALKGYSVVDRIRNAKKAREDIHGTDPWRGGTPAAAVARAA